MRRLKPRRDVACRAPDSAAGGWQACNARSLRRRRSDRLDRHQAVSTPWYCDSCRGTPHPTQVRAVLDRLERAPLDKLKPRILLDYTGVGRPVFDMFRQAGLLRGEAIAITGGRETSETEFGYSVPKVTLVSRLQALLHSGDLRIPRVLPDAAVLTRELQEFRVKYTDAGNATFNAREGEHDDLVLALAIAVFGLSESQCATSESMREYSHRQFFSR